MFQAVFTVQINSSIQQFVVKSAVKLWQRKS